MKLLSIALIAFFGLSTFSAMADGNKKTETIVERNADGTVKTETETEVPVENN